MPRRRGDHTKKKGRDDARSRAWRAMDVLGIFTIPQLRMASDITDDNARRYLLHLQRLGFVKKIRTYRYHVAGAHSVWKLLKWTGPHSPIAMKDGRLFDPNTQTIHELDPMTKQVREYRVDAHRGKVPHVSTF